MSDVSVSVKNDVQKYGVEILDSSAPAFDDELAKSISDKDLFSMVREATPLAIVLKNKSVHEIIGVSLRWKLEMSDGEIRILPQGQTNPGIFLGLRSRDRSNGSLTSFILPGEAYVFCFNPLLQRELTNAIAHRRAVNTDGGVVNGTGGGIYPIGLSSGEKRSSIAFQSSKALEGVARVSVSVDGIFFDDGTFVGPNENFTFESVAGQVQARTDFLSEVRKGEWIGIPDANILSDFNLAETALKRPNARYAENEPNPETAFQRNYAQQAISLRKQFLMQRSILGDSLLFQRYQLENTEEPSLRKLKDDK